MALLTIVPPSNIELEALVLGTLLQESRAIIDIEGVLTANSFYKEEHKIIYSAIDFLHNKGMEIDISSVSVKLRKENLLKEIGGAVYISEFSNNMSYNLVADANELKELYTKRELIKICQKTLRDINNVDGKEQLERIEKEVFSLSVKNENDIETLGTIAARTLKDMEAQFMQGGYTGVQSGFKDLDKITGGFQPSNLIVIGAGTSMGKTTIGLNLAINACNKGKKVAVFSLEMSKGLISKRFLAMETSINTTMLRDVKDLNTTHWEKLTNAVDTFSNLDNIFINDLSGLTTGEIRTKARSLKQRHGLDILIIDYLQLIKSSEKMREQAISQIASDLHAIAKELNIPIIAFSQINKEHETKESKRPKLSDLRESAGIGNASDLVILLHRPAFWGIIEDENGNSTKGITELIIAKHRDGELGTVKIKMHPETSKFTDIEEAFDSYIIPSKRSDTTKKSDEAEQKDEEDTPF